MKAKMKTDSAYCCNEVITIRLKEYYAYQVFKGDKSKKEQLYLMLKYLLPYTNGPDLIKEFLLLDDDRINDWYIERKPCVLDNNMLVGHTYECLTKTAFEIRNLYNMLENYKKSDCEFVLGWYEYEVTDRIEEYIGLFKALYQGYIKMAGHKEAKELFKIINMLLMRLYFGNVYIQIEV